MFVMLVIGSTNVRKPFSSILLNNRWNMKDIKAVPDKN